jgi:hypothetical protein
MLQYQTLHCYCKYTLLYWRELSKVFYLNFYDFVEGLMIVFDQNIMRLKEIIMFCFRRNCLICVINCTQQNGYH